jgi:hypothetical protein
MIPRDRLRWDGDNLYCDNRLLASIEPDARYPNMWRVRLPSGKLSDMLSRTRARDAARSLALAQLNARAAA